MMAKFAKLKVEAALTGCRLFYAVHVMNGRGISTRHMLAPYLPRCPPAALCRRLPCIFEFLKWKPLEYVDHCLVRNLAEIRIVSASGAEEFVIFKADDLVGLAAQLRNSIRRRHRHCENEFFGSAYAGSAQGCARRCPGGDPIVDHDGGTAADIWALAPAQIPLTPPLDFGQLAVADLLEFGFVNIPLSPSHPRSAR